MDDWLESFARTAFRRSADTAHDLKTPLNVAVLNLELLRMRLRKICDSDDEKVVGYMGAVEAELRRLGRIFDAFFLMSTPPHNGPPAAIEVSPIVREYAAAVSVKMAVVEPARIVTHEARIRQAIKLFFEGAAKLLTEVDAAARADRDAERYFVTLEGKPVSASFEPTRIFKFYYTDPEGTPDLSLSVCASHHGDLWW